MFVDCDCRKRSQNAANQPKPTVELGFIILGLMIVNTITISVIKSESKCKVLSYLGKQGLNKLCFVYLHDVRRNLYL